MGDGIEIDTSELRALAATLASSAASVAGEVRPVVVRGGVNIKKQLRDEMSSSRHFKGAARDIDFDVSSGPGYVETLVGPRSGPGNPGALANIAYFGTSRGGGTVADPRGALEAEAEPFEKALGDLVVKSLGGR